MPSTGFLLQQFQLYAGDAGGGLRPVVCVLGARRTSHGRLQHLTALITHYFRRLLCSDLVRIVRLVRTFFQQLSGPNPVTPPNPTLMAHKALKAHTSTQRAHRALKAHTSTQRAHRALKAHTSTQRAHKALKAHTSTRGRPTYRHPGHAGNRTGAPRPTCPGVPWGVHGPKTMGEAQRLNTAQSTPSHQEPSLTPSRSSLSVW
jgi:hypothetical protein